MCKKASLLNDYKGWFTGIGIKVKGIYIAGAIGKNYKTGAIIGSFGIGLSTSKRPVSFAQTYYVLYTGGNVLKELISGLRSAIYNKVAFIGTIGALLL